MVEVHDLGWEILDIVTEEFFQELGLDREVVEASGSRILNCALR